MKKFPERIGFETFINAEDAFFENFENISMERTGLKILFLENWSFAKFFLTTLLNRPKNRVLG